MKTEAEIRQQLKKIEETKVALERVIGTSRAAPAVGITDITLGPMIAMLKWVLDDVRKDLRDTLGANNDVDDSYPPMPHL